MRPPVDFGVHVVTDRSGNIAAGAAQNPDSPISLGGNPMVGMHLVSADGQRTCYNGLAGGVERWAAKHGIGYELFVIDVDLDAQTATVRKLKQVDQASR
jgi:hypothetical protein